MPQTQRVSGMSEVEARELSLCRWTEGPWTGQHCLQDWKFRDNTFALYDIDGTLFSQLPNGKWEKVKVIGVYDGGDVVAFLDLLEQVEDLLPSQ